MDAAARGIGFYFYLRRRWISTAYLLYLVVALLAYHLPDFPHRQEFLIVLSAPLGGVFLYLLALFTDADQDLLLSTRSSYPPHLLTLPVTTRALVLWPMFYAMTLLPLIWLLFASAVLVPMGAGAYIWAPAALLAALVAVMQALCWSPLPFPYLRIILLIISIPGLGLLGVIGQLRGWSSGSLCAMYLAFIPVCVGIALRGVRLARLSAQPEWNGWQGQSLTDRKQARKAGEMQPAKAPFTTPLHAQIGMEWKRNGLLSPVIVFCINLLFGLLFRISNSEVWLPTGIREIEVPGRVCAFLIVLPVTVLTCSMGFSLRKSHTTRTDMSLQPFLATRPLTCIEIVAAKLMAFVRVILATWAVQLLFLVACLFSPARQVGIHAVDGTIATLVLSNLTPRYLEFVFGGLVSLVFLSGCLGVNNLWVELYGRQWLYNLYAFLNASVFSGLVGLFFLLGTGLAPEHLPLVQALRWLPSIMAVLCVTKLTFTAWVFIQLLRYQLATPRLLTAVAGIWAAIVTGLFLLLPSLLPAGYVTPFNLACSIALLVPVARLSLAPLTLYANRHR